jgi:hypothetical protein
VDISQACDVLRPNSRARANKVFSLVSAILLMEPLVLHQNTVSLYLSTALRNLCWQITGGPQVSFTTPQYVIFASFLSSNSFHAWTQRVIPVPLNPTRIKIYSENCSIPSRQLQPRRLSDKTLASPSNPTVDANPAKPFARPPLVL